MPPTQPSDFELILPLKAKCVSLARLVVAGIASHTSLSLDDIEDCKIATSEAFNFFLSQVKRLNSSPLKVDLHLTQEDLRITMTVDGLFLKKTWDQMSSRQSNKIVSQLILKRLMDVVKLDQTKQGSKIKLVKHLTKP